jgi:F0F1-type ATP synthase assembly protein I
MPQINYLAVLAATIGAFVLSGIWYAVFGDAMKGAQPNPEQQTKMSPWQIGAELVRSAVVALVLGYLLSRLQTGGWAGAVAIGLLLWLAFPAVLLAGSVVHENVKLKLAAIHAGDWLVKLVLIASITGLWR